MTALGDLIDGAVAPDALRRRQVFDAVEEALFPQRRSTPLMLGRYRVLERVGGGGSGVVHAAWDTELDRRVAVKLLLGDATDRLVREAKLLARLSHPNVVPVYDIGTYDRRELDGREGEGVYLVMELATGGDLTAWLGAAERSWSEVLAMYLDAGRGLSAAHAKGLVHRDFKPANVLVGEDGRARVVDFGLARDAADEHVAPVAGTPRYMPPEQRAGAPANAAADQYAFCTALAEAVPGHRRIGAVLTRGRSDDPADRYPSMDVLLRRLTTVLEGGRARTLVPVLVLLAVVGIGTAAWVSAAGDEGPTLRPAVVGPGECDPPEFIALIDRSASMGGRIDMLAGSLKRAVAAHASGVRFGLALLPHDKGDDACAVAGAPKKRNWARLCEEPGAEVVIEPSLDGAAALHAFDLGAVSLCFGGAPSLALRAVGHQLAPRRTQRRDQVVVLVTDTPDNCGSTLGAVRELAAQGVYVHVVPLVGPEEGVDERLWRAELNFLACAGGSAPEGSCRLDSSGVRVPTDPAGPDLFAAALDEPALTRAFNAVLDRHACSNHN